VKFRASRGLEGETIRSATLTREGKHWFVSLLVDDAITTPAEHVSPGTAVGVDRGVVVAVATSAGDLFDQVFTTPGQQRRAVRLQRKLSRAAKGARPTATRPGTRWARYGLASGAAARTSVLRPHTGWRTTTPWSCWKNCP
jgi:putative transposase